MLSDSFRADSGLVGRRGASTGADSEIILEEDEAMGVGSGVDMLYERANEVVEMGREQRERARSMRRPRLSTFGRSFHCRRDDSGQLLRMGLSCVQMQRYERHMTVRR